LVEYPLLTGRCRLFKFSGAPTRISDIMKKREHAEHGQAFSALYSTTAAKFKLRHYP